MGNWARDEVVAEKWSRKNEPPRKYDFSASAGFTYYLHFFRGIVTLKGNSHNFRHVRSTDSV